jgi:LmbE family N-acetylglucosaminyl deacetylase
MNQPTTLPAYQVHAAMRALPILPLDAVAPGRSLILAPHADDESLGCGGLIAALAEAARPPIIVCVTDGSASHPGSRSHPPRILRDLREAELRAAIGELGVPGENLVFLRLPDARCPADGPEAEQAAVTVASLIREHGITTIFATSPHDPHCDHEATGILAAKVAKRTNARLRYYPVWSWLLPATKQLPLPRGCRLDITSHLPAKRRAIAAHASQYAGLITDSEDAFQLPATLLAIFESTTEVFLIP